MAKHRHYFIAAFLTFSLLQKTVTAQETAAASATTDTAAPATELTKEETDRQISQKLYALKHYLDKQNEMPPFEQVFQRAIWSFKGTPYEGFGHDPIGAEKLIIKTDKVGCVSLIEISLALARVAYCHSTTIADVYNEVRRLRYRQGEVVDFNSRLHYFSEWLSQAEANNILEEKTMVLGGRLMQREFNWMSTHPALYPPMTIRKNRQAMMAIEEKLSHEWFPIIDKEYLPAIEPLLEPGDILAIISNNQGIIISHVSMVTKLGEERHIFHASSHLKRVGTSGYTVSEYLNNSEKRLGVRVLRVLPPTCPLD